MSLTENKKTMRKIFSIIILLTIVSINSFGQAAWIEPNPANVNAEVKIMIDVSQPACECPLLIDADINGDSLYIWTWEPSENATIPNGQWNASSPELKMTSEGNNIWSYTLVPTQFYGVDASTVYDIGISFLIKKIDGSATDDGEPKSADQHVDLDPMGCVDKVCAFPQYFQEDDYLTIIYNNTLEENAGLQNIAEGDCYWLPTVIAGGVEYQYTTDDFSQTIATDYPELQMPLEGNGKFAETILSDEFFRSPGLSPNPVPDGVKIEMIKVRFRKPTFTGNISTFSELEFKCEE